MTHTPDLTIALLSILIILKRKKGIGAGSRERG